MQAMMGTLRLSRKLVTLKTNQYEELRGKAIDEDSVCDESMNTAPDKGEEDENTDALSSVSAKGRREALSRSRADRVTNNVRAAPGVAAEKTHTKK